MPRQSSLTVTYANLVKLGIRALSEAQARYDGARARGTTNLEPLAHDVETARTLVRMLQKGQPVKQANLFKLYEQVTK